MEIKGATLGVALLVAYILGAFTVLWFMGVV